MSVEWKKQSAKKIDLILGSLSSISSLETKAQDLFMLALSPVGGSFVSLIDLSKIPIGTPLDGSADKKSLKLGLPPELSPENESRIFSSSISQVGIR